MNFKKTAAAVLAAGMLASLLSGCGDKNKPSEQITQQVQLQDELDKSITKSKVISVDLTAKDMPNEVNVWLVDDLIAGGNPISSATIIISADKGNVTLTNTPTKSTNHSKSLEEIIEDNYADNTFYSEVFINDEGKAWAVTFVEGLSNVDNGVLPTESDFKNGTFAWKDEEHIGMTRSGLIVGTIPKLMIKK